MSNTFGSLFRVTTFGESHGGGVGCVIDGCPPGLELSIKDFRLDLDRRKTGQSYLTSGRKEKEEVEILSGVFEGKTLGSPILLLIRNTDAKPSDYKQVKDKYRPSHADYTYDAKYGIRNWQGGGRASARETTARVLAGVIAKKILKKASGLEIVGYVKQVGEIGSTIDPLGVTLKKVESNAVRCPDAKVAKLMEEAILKVKSEGDTLGGVVECVCKNVPVGLGDPVFGKIKAVLAHGMMSLPATMGFEIGSGFGSLGMKGSEHNDVFRTKERMNGRTKERMNPFGSSDKSDSLRAGSRTDERVVVTETNNSGGQQGGITNGMPLVFRVVFKPVATIFKEQETVTSTGRPTRLLMPGRHDPCVVPRAVVMVEAMAALVLVDALMKQKVIEGLR